ncbi:MAG: TetR/AcrR family transcriptional regulator [Chloroflexi bacterium]|nr:TetR/AcrR family transcriptional regulator [Chloroflexota bacterium]
MNKSSKSEDLRVRRTRKLVWEALMELILERDFDFVTVNDICERAMVHRTTFYNHFQDKFDLLASGMATMYEEFTTELASPLEAYERLDPDHPPAYFVQLFQHILDNKLFYTAMLTGRGVNPFRERLLSYLTQVSLQRLKYVQSKLGSARIPLEMTACFYAGAIISTATWWANEGFRETPTQISHHLIHLISYGTTGLFKSVGQTPVTEIPLIQEDSETDLRSAQHPPQGHF